MVKASANKVAESNDADPAEGAQEGAEKRIICEWIGDDANPRVKGRTARELTRKQVGDNLLMKASRDLYWGHETAYRADVSEENETFLNWLKEQPEFKVTEED